MLQRDPAREQRWLEDAAGPSQTFAPHARRRLDRGETDYGDRWTRTPLDRLLAELAEEAADLGAWSVLIAQALDAEGVPADVREHVTAALRVAARAGGEAHAAVERALVCAGRA